MQTAILLINEIELFYYIGCMSQGLISNKFWKKICKNTHYGYDVNR